MMRRLAMLLLLCLVFPAGSYAAQSFGGDISFGGKPSAALVVGAPACNVLTNVNSIAVGTNASGASRLSLAVIQYNGNPTVPTVGNGKQNYALVGTADATGQVQASIWRLIAPTLGTATVTAQLSGIVGAISLCVIEFENVHQTTPASGFVWDAQGSNSVALSTSSAAGDMAISVFVSANNAITSANDTAINAATPGSIIVTRIGKQIGAATVNFNSSLAGTNVWGAGLINIVKAP